MSQEEQELSDDQLEQVAGGMSDLLQDEILKLAPIAGFTKRGEQRLRQALSEHSDNRRLEEEIHGFREEYINYHGSVPDIHTTAKWVVKHSHFVGAVLNDETVENL